MVTLISTLFERITNGQTLYIHRPVLNGNDIVTWAKSVGFDKTLDPKDMHVTIAYSKKPVKWWKIPKTHDNLTIEDCGHRKVTPLGDQGAVVLKITSPTLQARWKQLCDLGASWDFPSYQPHVTISYDAKHLNTDVIPPFTGDIMFGAEVKKPIDDNWHKKVKEK